MTLTYNIDHSYWDGEVFRVKDRFVAREGSQEVEPTLLTAVGRAALEDIINEDIDKELAKPVTYWAHQNIGRSMLQCPDEIWEMVLEASRPRSA